MFVSCVVTSAEQSFVQNPCEARVGRTLAHALLRIRFRPARGPRRSGTMWTQITRRAILKRPVALRFLLFPDLEALSFFGEMFLEKHAADASNAITSTTQYQPATSIPTNKALHSIRLNALLPLPLVSPNELPVILLFFILNKYDPRF